MNGEQDRDADVRFFIGLDLAFSSKNNSGIVILKGDGISDGLQYVVPTM